jgi:hypothetical protein
MIAMIIGRAQGDQAGFKAGKIENSHLNFRLLDVVD